MANEEGRGCENEVKESSSGSPSSASNRVKFMCSHGGNIMPRPADGQLKYIGGETRVIAVPRDITFSELMKKLSAEFEGDMILRYQVMPEELDVLVSVITNKDLKHMFDEYDRNEIGGTPKLRAFLFPSNHVPVENLPFTSACNRVRMHKVHSTPNLCSLSMSPRQSSSQLNTYHFNQHHHPCYQQQHRSPHDHYRLAPALSSVRHHTGRSPAGPGVNHWYTSRLKMGSGNSN